jgi:hypothetical protein
MLNLALCAGLGLATLLAATAPAEAARRRGSSGADAIPGECFQPVPPGQATPYVPAATMKKRAAAISVHGCVIFRGQRIQAGATLRTSSSVMLFQPDQTGRVATMLTNDGLPTEILQGTASGVTVVSISVGFTPGGQEIVQSVSRNILVEVQYSPPKDLPPPTQTNIATTSSMIPAATR